MAKIEYYVNESERHDIECESVARWYVDNKELFHYAGFKMYEISACNDNDITHDFDRIMKAESVIVLKAAEGPVSVPTLIIAGVLAATVAVAVAVLYSKTASVSTDTGSTSTSTTNALGDRENSDNIGGRCDDIWGTVEKATPPLIGYPLRRFENNIEVEIFPLFISEGKVSMSKVKEGDTPLNSMSGAQFNAWYNGKNPNNGDTPDYTIGGTIDRNMQTVRVSSEVQETELLPPNDLALGAAATWTVSADGTNATLTLTNPSALDDVDLQEYFSVGAELVLYDCYYASATGTQLLHYATSGGHETANFTTVELIDVSGDYEITAVTSNTVTVTGFSFTTGTTSLVSTYWTVTADSASGMSDFITTSSYILDEVFYVSYDSGTYTYQVTPTRTDIQPDVGQVLSNTIGPITIYSGTEVASFNFVAASGFYKIVETTNKSVTANILITIQETDSDGVATGNSFTQNVSFTSNSGSITKQAAQTVEISIPYTYCRAICRRTTNRDKSSNVSTVDQVYWRDLYFLNDPGTLNFGDCTTAMVVIPSTVTSRSESNRLINLTATRMFQPYLSGGTYGTEQAVSTWAETLIALALDSKNGRLPISAIDAELLLEIQEQLIEYYGFSDFVKVGWDIDDNSLRFQDIFTTLCDAVMVEPYSQGGVFKAYAKIDRTESSKQFTHRNKIPDTDTRERSYNRDYDGIHITYRSNSTGNSEDLYFDLYGTDSVSYNDIDLTGVVTEAQATIRGKRELNMLKYQRDTFTFEGDGLTLLAVLGERVDNVDYSRIVKRDSTLPTLGKYQIYSGEVKSQSGLTVELSEPVEFTDGETHTIRFTSRSGDLLESIECTAGSNPYSVVLSTTPSEALYTGYKADKTQFTFAADSERDSLPCIVTSIEGNVDGTYKTREVTLVNYDSRYFTNDKDYA